jgi:D-alanyl-D-alanine carboxypeptidase
MSMVEDPSAGPPPGPTPGGPGQIDLPQADMQQAPPPEQGLPTPDDAIPQNPMDVQGAQQTMPEAQPSGPPAVGGLNHLLADRFGRLQQAVKEHGGMLYIYSGARDHDQQHQLYKDAVGKYGSEAEAKKHVSPPGKTDHDPHAGLALGIGDGAIGVDIRGDLAIAHKLAPHFGLEFSKKQPWHMNIAGIK